LLGIGGRIDSVISKKRAFDFAYPTLAFLGPVMVHGKVVGDSKHPCSWVRIWSATNDLADEPKKSFLDYIFAVFPAKTIEAQVGVKGRTQLVVKLDNLLAIPRRRSFVAEDQLPRRHRHISDIRSNQFSIPFSSSLDTRTSPRGRVLLIAKKRGLFARPEAQDELRRALALLPWRVFYTSHVVRR
jgi:hypothetical protein